MHFAEICLLQPFVHHYFLSPAFTAVTDGRFGSGSGQFGLTSVTCGGSEETLAACEHNEWTTAGICHGGATVAAGVQCDGKD